MNAWIKSTAGSRTVMNAPVFLSSTLRQLTAATTLSLSLLLLCNAAAQAAPNEIFPALPAAQSAVNWKDGYFYINGQPTIIRSGSIHYARVPREQWRDRIWRLKMMAFNCVQSYVFWNASCWLFSICMEANQMGCS